MSKKRHVAPDRRKLRNLVQYKDLSDDEFNAIFEDRFEKPFIQTEDIGKAIDKKIEELGEDYDLEDMKINDHNLLRLLAQAEIQLEYIEQVLFEIRSEESYTIDNVTLVEKLNRIASGLRSDIGSLGETLAISRKERRKDQETSVQDAISKLRDSAKKYAERTMVYVFCPSCKLLLLTAWLQAGEKTTKVETTCPRCGEELSLVLEDLYKTDNRNIEGVKLA